MSSAADIVRRAMKRLGVLAGGEEPSAREAEDGNAALNGMIASWAAHGVDVSPDVPLPARHEEGVISLLAVRLAPDFGMTAPQQVAIDAENGWQALLAEYIRAPSAQFDPALINMPSQRQWVGRTNPSLWRPQYAYSIGDVVQYRGRIYECTTAGTSGATVGPTGRTTASDGNVSWTFVGVI